MCSKVVCVWAKVPGSANNCSLLVHFVQHGFNEGMSIMGRCQTVQICCITLGDWGCLVEGNGQKWPFHPQRLMVLLNLKNRGRCCKHVVFHGVGGEPKWKEN